MPGGRRSKLREEDIERTTELLAEGATGKDLASAFGVHIDTIYKWRRKGEDIVKNGIGDKNMTPHEERCVEFYHAYEQGRSERRKSLISIIENQMPEDWRAAKWYLERQFTDEFGDNKRMELESDDGVSLTIDLSAAEQEDNDG